MQGDECEIRKPEREQGNGDHIEHERLFEPERLRFLFGFFKDFRVRVSDAGEYDQSDGDERRNAEQRKAQPVSGKQRAGSFQGYDQEENDRTDKRAELIQKFKKRKPLAYADFACRKTDERVLCRLLDRLAHALQSRSLTALVGDEALGFEVVGDEACGVGK